MYTMIQQSAHVLHIGDHVYLCIGDNMISVTASKMQILGK